MKIGLILILLSLIFVVGCTQVEDNSIATVKKWDLQLCLSKEATNAPGYYQLVAMGVVNFSKPSAYKLYLNGVETGFETTSKVNYIVGDQPPYAFQAFFNEGTNITATLKLCLGNNREDIIRWKSCQDITLPIKSFCPSLNAFTVNENRK